MYRIGQGNGVDIVMSEQHWNLEDAIEFYRGQGAPYNQTALVELLREVQRENGDVIPANALQTLTKHMGLKPSFLAAIIKRYPSLRTEEAPHRLEVCGDKRCQRQNCAKLHAFIETRFEVTSGSISKAGGFLYKITGCMKNCGRGPSLKWDGKLYPYADQELVLSLVKDKSK